jgi:hypothetical protein
MRLLNIVFFLLCIQASAQQDKVYKTTDKNGVIRYSDKAQDGATQIILPAANQLSSLQLAPKKPTSLNLSSTSINQGSATTSDVTILEPSNGQTIRSNPGSVPVSVSISPKPLGTTLVQAVINNQAVGNFSESNFTLQGLPRGEHSLIVKITDQSGKVLALSDPVTFYLFRQSIIKPN